MKYSLYLWRIRRRRTNQHWHKLCYLFPRLVCVPQRVCSAESKSSVSAHSFGSRLIPFIDSAVLEPACCHIYRRIAKPPLSLMYWYEFTNDEDELHKPIYNQMFDIHGSTLHVLMTINIPEAEMDLNNFENKYIDNQQIFSDFLTFSTFSTFSTFCHVF